MPPRDPSDAGPLLRPPTRQRALTAAAIGLTAGVIAFLLHSRPGFHPDYVLPWQAARYWLGGRDPYAALPGGLPEPFTTPLLYPFTTVLAAVPFARLALPVASAATMGISAALLTWVLSAGGWPMLWILASAPFAMAVNLGQWSPLVLVAALQPSSGALALLKPNLGAAVLAWRPAPRALASAGIALIGSLVLFPTWPLRWLDAVRSVPGHPAPVLAGHGAGLLLLLAALRWRRDEARLLLAMACVPQLPLFADQLPLLLVARTVRERQALVFSSLVAFVAWFATALWLPDRPYVPLATPFVLGGCYAPALWMVLRRPNEAAPPRP